MAAGLSHGTWTRKSRISRSVGRSQVLASLKIFERRGCPSSVFLPFAATSLKRVRRKKKKILLSRAALLYPLEYPLGARFYSLFCEVRAREASSERPQLFFVGSTRSYLAGLHDLIYPRDRICHICSQFSFFKHTCLFGGDVPFPERHRRSVPGDVFGVCFHPSSIRLSQSSLSFYSWTFVKFGTSI